MDNKRKNSLLCLSLSHKTSIIIAIIISCIIAIIAGVILYNNHIQNERQKEYIEEQQAKKTIDMYDTENLQAAMGFSCVKDSLISEKYKIIDTESIELSNITQVLKSVMNEDSPKYFAFHTKFTYEIKYREQNTGKGYITYKAASVGDSASECYIDGINRLNLGNTYESYVDHSISISTINEILENFNLYDISVELNKRLSKYEDVPSSLINE